jgi:hypothetical protein
MPEKLLYCNATRKACDHCKDLAGVLYDPGAEPTLPIHEHCHCYYLYLNIDDAGNITLAHRHGDIEAKLAEVRGRMANILHVLESLLDQLQDLIEGT